MSKLIALVNPFTTRLSSAAVSSPKVSSRVSFVPAKARTIATARRHSLVQSASFAWAQYGVYTLIALNVAMIAGYIVSINASAAAGYEITAMQRKVHVLQEDNKKLTLQNSEMDSMVSIHEDLSSRGYVPISNPQYISVAPHHLTQR
jgi:hypothetical protein